MTDESAPRHANRLAGETSPYLLQHAHNPVDWYPWGKEALGRAQAEDKPILLSIGYSACHWCHVMERESFENAEIAELMNRWFVSIKVDREERPDLDAIYMQAVQEMNQGRGGWPMTVCLTPDGTPFWGGTYFPPEDRGGSPGFRRVLSALADAWAHRRDAIDQSARQMHGYLQHTLEPALSASGELSVDTLDAAAEGILRLYDPTWGGYGGAPKFPQPMAIEFLLRQWFRTGIERYRESAVHTLGAMARGGMYDQLGGGFARYSTDSQWLIPHFEKMLYDNAQLARAYLMAFQATGHPAFRVIGTQTLDYVLREMTDPQGGFYSSEDADSEGEEGRYYVWTPAELTGLLGEGEARMFGAFYGVTPDGNFEHGTSILQVRSSPAEAARAMNLPEERLRAVLERGQEILFEARSRRVRPDRDEKVLAAWNGMLLRALAEASRILGRTDYRDAAVRNATFLLNQMRAPDGRLLRSWKAQAGARLNGYLEDQANVADGLLALYEATYDDRWLRDAQAIMELVIERFADPQGGFRDTSDDHEALIARPRDLFDNATPAGSSVAIDVLLRLAAFTGQQRYRDHAEQALRLVADLLPRSPVGFGRALSALDFYLGRLLEVAVIGEPGATDTQELVRAVYEPFLPNKVVAGASNAEDAAATGWPLLAERGMLNGRATAYVCEAYVCGSPATAPDELRAQLAAAAQPAR